MEFVSPPLLVLSAFAEDHGRKAVDECEGRTLRSSKSEGGCFGGFRRRNEGYHGRKPVEASFFLLGSVLIGWFFLRPIQSTLRQKRDDRAWLLMQRQIDQLRAQFGQKLVFADTKQTEPFEARALERETG